MPEFKHQFTGGKMNKDLDERLIPEGEYRDAMNVQVSTSEGSDVGTVQNILPNNLGCMSGGVSETSQAVSPLATTIGSISDEKNDSFYWFVSGMSTLSSYLAPCQIVDTLQNNGQYLFKDVIMQGVHTVSPDTSTTCQPVFVDIWGFAVTHTSSDPDIDRIQLPTTDLSNLVQAGWMVSGFNVESGCSGLTTVKSVISSGGEVPVEPDVITTSTRTSVGFVDKVMLGVTQNPSTGNYAFNHKIYIWTPPGANDYAPNHNPPGSEIKVGDEIDALEWVGSSPAPQGITITFGSSSSQSTPANEVTGVTMFQYNDDNGTPHNFTEITIAGYFLTPGLGQTALSQAIASAMTQGFYTGNNSAIMGTDLVGSIGGSVPSNPSNTSNKPGGATVLQISPGSVVSNNTFGNLQWSRVSTTPIIDPSGIVTFDNSFNYLFSGLVPGTNILYNATYPISNPSPGALQNGGCINYINLASNPSEIIIDDCAGNIVLPVDIYSGTGIGNSFFIRVPSDQTDTTVIFENNLPTKGTQGNDLNYMFMNPTRVLDFNIDNLITAKNIIDDLLFWSDGHSEPKKINIPRSILGTDPAGNKHTEVINDYVQPTNGLNVLSRQEHVTVIKRSPTKAITVSTETYFDNQTDPIIVNGGEASGNKFGGGGGAGVKPGESILLSFASFYFAKGDILKFSTTYSDLPDEYEIRAIVTDIYLSTPANYTWATDNHKVVRFEILTVLDNADTDASNSPIWYTVGENNGKRLFERKLPRFAYRYKYLDNEYSAISPFTDVIFEPTDFRYHPTEAYNTGMINNLKSITLKDFVQSDMPADVIQIDLLYKNDTDPAVYLIESITNKEPNFYDPVANATYRNTWNLHGTVATNFQVKQDEGFFTSGSYKVETENIYAALPSNQTLRAWDNVPKTSLAQEIVGNRIVYGNYTQNYSLENILPKIGVNLQTRYFRLEDDEVGRKSIKSIRNYDIGVVWGDKYGRETPVIAPNSGSLKVPKSRAEQSTFINLELENSPTWANYYKFYIKETSNEYYNLALGRAYLDGEDDNIWLAFPSIDRNKVDDDTYLILKKGAGKDAGLIIEDARFKIVAIENEAPDQIKTSYTKLLRTRTDASRPTDSHDLYGITSSAPFGAKNAPTAGQLGFSLDFNIWTGGWNGLNTSMGLASPLTIFEEVSANTGDNSSKDELWVQFSIEKPNTDVQWSTRYHVIEVKTDEVFGSTPQAPTAFIIKLASPILSKDSFITAATNLTNDDVHVHFWKRSIENKPEFDGRFFVKIYNDRGLQGVVEKNLLTIAEPEQNWAVTATTSVYKIEDADNANMITSFDTGTQLGNVFGSANPQSNTNTSSNPRTKTQWSTALKFDKNSTQGFWFIDGATFAGYQSSNNDRWNTSSTTFNNVDSCDKVSDISGSLNYSKYSGAVVGTVTFSLSSLLNLTGGASVSTAVGNGLSHGNLRMKGNYSDGTTTQTIAGTTASAPTQYFDLSYSKLEPTGNVGKTQDYNLDWRVGHPLNSSTDEEIEIVQNLTFGKRFRFSGNDTIYKIISATKHRLYNYKGKGHVNDGIPATFNYLGTFWSNYHKNEETYDMAAPENRRLTYRIQYELDESYNGAAGAQTGSWPLSSNTTFTAITNTSPESLEFLTEFMTEGENKISTHPAIFETEPKEDLDLDLYYEASNNIATFPVNDSNKHMFIPIGATVEPLNNPGQQLPQNIFVTGWSKDANGVDQIHLSSHITRVDALIFSGQGVKFVRDDGSFTSIEPGFTLGDTQGAVASTNEVNFFTDITPNKKIGLGWFNCWSFGNGVESNRIGDTFNKPFITNGARVSTVLGAEYSEEQRKYGLIYSGIYNSNSGVNNLNQFIAAEKITKDINPIYGSIQKLHSRNSDLVALCEDKILKILADKDALFNADGNMQLTSTNNVLGKAIPFAGEYGISKNPESFASESYRMYFTDKVRGAVLRLSKDGLTPISDYGMKDWFGDNLKLYSNLIGSYDDNKGEYNVTLIHDFDNQYKPQSSNAPRNSASSTKTQNDPTTVSFQENVKGWVSFKSFILENGVNCANDYFSFKKGQLYRHHVEDASLDKNTFYSTYANSSVTFIFNQAIGSIKSFETLNYEGTQSQIINRSGISNVANLPSTVNLENYGMEFEFQTKEGWYVESVETEQDKGSLEEFVNKEGKWFNYIVGKQLNVAGDNTASDFTAENFAHQGLGRIGSTPTTTPITGCTDSTSFNYNPAAVIDDGSCASVALGCTDANAFNYNASANTDDFSCLYYGCTDNNANNYDASATNDDGTCTYCTYGCTDATAFNYSAINNCDGQGGLVANGGMSCSDLGLSVDCDCIPTISGCLDSVSYTHATVSNFSNTANTQDNSCIYTGCSDPSAEYPLIPLQIPYDANTPIISMVNSSGVYSGGDEFIGCWPIVNSHTADQSLADYQSYVTLISNTFAISSLTPCPTSPNDTTNCTYPPAVSGCMDNAACFPTPNAVSDDGSCLYCGDINYYNYDGGTLSNGSLCGPTTSPASGSCISCPHVSQTILNTGLVFSSSTSVNIPGSGFVQVSTATITFEVVYDGTFELDLTTPFTARVYNVANLPAGYVAQTDAPYEEIDVNTSNTYLATTSTSTVGTITTDVYNFNITGGLTAVSKSRNGGSSSPVVNTGYNGSAKMTLTPGGDYIMHMRTNCSKEQPDGSFISTFPQGTSNMTSLLALTNPAVALADGFVPSHNNVLAALPVSGCTDSTALNHNPSANTDDGSCYYVIGCMDPNATNFNPLADYSAPSYLASACTYPIPGCTDNTACNFDPSATTDDGSCTGLKGCTDVRYCNYDPNATCGFQSLCTGGFVGCMDPNADNFDASHLSLPHDPSWANNAASCNSNSALNGQGNPSYVANPTGNEVGTIVDVTCQYSGCTDPTAGNYSFPNSVPAVTSLIGLSPIAYGPVYDSQQGLLSDDGSCGTLGCTTINDCNYNPNATIHDPNACQGICGCTYESSCNYDPLATVEDGTCTFCDNYTTVNNMAWPVVAMPIVSRYEYNPATP